jgi:hypothetical protein
MRVVEVLGRRHRAVAAATGVNHQSVHNLLQMRAIHSSLNDAVKFAIYRSRADKKSHQTSDFGGRGVVVNKNPEQVCQTPLMLSGMAGVENMPLLDRYVVAGAFS